MTAFTVIIPARYGSTRLPAKALADIEGQPLIWHVVQRGLESKAQRVLVATDDQRIADVLQNTECQVVMTSADHQSGSDRLAEVVTSLQLADHEIVINIQGDEPLVPPRLINDVAEKLTLDTEAMMATAAQAIHSAEDFTNPNVVKVVVDQNHRALYFSRAAIPHHRGQEASISAWHHIGIYAYRVGFLKQFSAMQPSHLEKLESLEQLRALEGGATISVVKIDYDAGIGVDTEADLERAREIMQSRAW